MTNFSVQGSKIVAGILIILLTFVVPLFGGDRHRYANVHVVAQCSDTGVQQVFRIYNGSSGLFLGTTTMDLLLSKNSKKAYPPLSLIIRKERDGGPTYWQIVKIQNWAKTRAEAMTAEKRNEVLFLVDCS